MSRVERRGHECNDPPALFPALQIFSPEECLAGADGHWRALCLAHTEVDTFHRPQTSSPLIYVNSELLLQWPQSLSILPSFLPLPVSWPGFPCGLTAHHRHRPRLFTHLYRPLFLYLDTPRPRFPLPTQPLQSDLFPFTTRSLLAWPVPLFAWLTHAYYHLHDLFPYAVYIQLPVI